MTEDERPLEAWRDCWRRGFEPQISDSGLEALRRALLDDDPNLIQGATTVPPPMQCCQDWPVERACPVGYAGWRGDGLRTVLEVEEYFAAVCFVADQRVDEAGGCRHFLNAVDEWPRPEMLRNLLPEVEHELAIRPGQTTPPSLRTDGMGESTGLASGNEAQVVSSEAEASDILRASERPRG
jgi:hypothetical protein